MFYFQPVCCDFKNNEPTELFANVFKAWNLGFSKGEERTLQYQGAPLPQGHP
jgi:hypothetical protein